MSSKRGDVVSLLDRPVYTFGEVDQLLGVNPGTARRWIDRRHHASETWVTWREFVETRRRCGYRDDDPTCVTVDARYPDIVLNPEIRSGRPTIADHSILATTLADMVRGGDSIERVANWYDLTIDQVQQAVDFTAIRNLAG